MEIDNILKTINQVDYENVEEVIIPTADLVSLRKEIVYLRSSLAIVKDKLTIANTEVTRVTAESLKILVNRADTVARFDTYA